MCGATGWCTPVVEYKLGFGFLRRRCLPSAAILLGVAGSFLRLLADWHAFADGVAAVSNEAQDIKFEPVSRCESQEARALVEVDYCCRAGSRHYPSVRIFLKASLITFSRSVVDKSVAAKPL